MTPPAQNSTGSSPGDGPVFSLVLPAYNEAARLPDTFRHIGLARDAYAGSDQDIEVVLANNASTDDTARIAGSYDCLVVHEEKRIISAVRNAGVRAARGTWVGCVDADTRIPPSSFNVIFNAIRDPKLMVGMTGARLDRDSPGIRFTTMACLIPAILFQMDTGIVFFRKADWEAIGGYDEAIFVAEDIDFLKRMGEEGKKTGRRRKRIKGAICRTSSRKFDQEGDLHIFRMAFKLFPLLMWKKKGNHPLVQRYWYERES